MESEIKCSDVMGTCLAEIRGMRDDVREIRATQLAHTRDISRLKVKSGLWSAVVSAFVALGAWLWHG